MPGVSKEQIARAKEWDLLSYLQRYSLRWHHTEAISFCERPEIFSALSVSRRQVFDGKPCFRNTSLVAAKAAYFVPSYSCHPQTGL